MIDYRRIVLEVAQAQGRVTSVAGVVFDRWGVVWDGAVGRDADVTAQYRVGSITKSLTAALTLLARDSGLLQLDDRLGDHLGAGVGYAETTLRDLLSHRSGMQSEPLGSWWERSPGTDLSTLLSRHDGSGRVAGPGEWFHYSNLGYALLGAVLERRTGRRWRDLVREELLVPLGMSRTSYLPRPYARAGWSVDHFTGVPRLEPMHDTGAMAPAGQLWSCVEDLARWGRFLAGSRPDLLAEESRAEMLRPTGEEYALGLFHAPHTSGVLVGHSGSMPGYLAAVMVEPGSGIGAAVLMDATTGLEPVQLVKDLIEPEDPDLFRTSPEPWYPTIEVPGEVRDLPGVWFWGNSAQELRWHNGGLDLHSMALGRRTDRFELAGGRLVGVWGYHRGEILHVVREPDGEVLRLECATFRYTRVPYPDEPADRWRPTR